MNRPQKVFSLIIGITLVIIIYILIVGPPPQCDPSDADCNESTNVPPLPTPLTEAISTAPPGASVTISSSDTKRDWLDDVISRFNGENHITAAGNPITVSAEHVRSGPSKDAILESKSSPVVWSPGDSSWVEQINARWEADYNKPINSQGCRPTVNAPVGFAIWRPMAETLGWPDQAIGWDTILELASDPEGWASYGHPEWGRFSFGHTHPAFSNTGLLSMTSFVYGALGYPELLTAPMVYDAENEMRALEQVTSKYGTSSSALLDLMKDEGPAYLHAAAVPEANVARYNIEYSDVLQFPLAFVIPAGGTIWANHPYCILDNADWVTPEQVEAAAIFLDYLLAKEQQALAIDHYIRPADTTIALHSPLDLEHGIDPTTSPDTETVLASPDSDISAAVQDLFGITKRKATIILALDTSGSMKGDMIHSATEATNEFLGRLDKDDELALMIFSNDVVTLYEPKRAGAVVEVMRGTVSTLIAGGETALYDAVCQATKMAARLKEEDQTNSESRLYGIVLLSDGDDTTSQSTENQMFVNCLPTNAEVDGFKIFSIAFGGDANKDVLLKISDVTGGRFFEADAETIGDIYESITAEQ